LTSILGQQNHSYNGRDYDLGRCLLVQYVFRNHYHAHISGIAIHFPRERIALTLAAYHTSPLKPLD